MVKPQIAQPRNPGKLVAQINAGQLAETMKAFDTLIVQHGTMAAAVAKAGEKAPIFAATHKTAVVLAKLGIPVGRVHRIALFQHEAGEVRAKVEVNMETPIKLPNGKGVVRKWTNVWDWVIVAAAKPAPVVVPAVPAEVVVNHPVPLVPKGTCEGCPEGMATFLAEVLDQKGTKEMKICKGCHDQMAADPSIAVDAVTLS